MTYLLAPEQRAMVETTRRFAREVVAPVAAELDRRPDPAECFSWEIVEKGHQVGIRTATLAPEYGGAGVDSLTTAVIVEELARADLGVSVVFAQTLKIAQVLQAAATANQQQRFIPPYADDPRGLLAIAITEPDTSSDYIVPNRNKSFLTKATKVEGGWVINGQKHFISNGNRARLYLVFAQTDPEKSLVEGSTCFLVERGTPGFRVGRVHDKMGERLANNSELFFEDCFVPDADVLGEVGGGFQVLARFFPASNAYAAASVLGWPKPPTSGRSTGPTTGSRAAATSSTTPRWPRPWPGCGCSSTPPAPTSTRPPGPPITKTRAGIPPWAPSPRCSPPRWPGRWSPTPWNSTAATAT